MLQKTKKVDWQNNTTQLQTIKIVHEYYNKTRNETPRVITITQTIMEIESQNST